MADFDTCLEFTLVNEIGDRRNPGGPLDWAVGDEPGSVPGKPGSPVCAGIDLWPWQTWFQDPSHPWPPNTRPSAEGFYRANFWAPLMGDSIANQVMAALLFDAGVNTWITHPVKLVQGLIGTAQDGILGPVSLAALNGASRPSSGPDSGLPAQFLSGMEAYYRTLRPAGDPELAEWLDRLNWNAYRLGVPWHPAQMAAAGPA